MRGVNLNVFAFDYDLTWAGFFLNADETIYGRFGGRDAESADKYLTLPALKHAMRAALAAHRKAVKEKVPTAAKPVRTVEQYPAGKKLRADVCIHCHQVYDFRRDEMKAAKKWSLDEVWVYPLPQNIGLSLDPDRGDRIKSVRTKSAAERAGLRTGDTLKALGGVPVASFADAQHALHLAPRSGRIAVVWERDGKERRGELELADGWRKTDISWRQSMWGLEPSPGINGRDLGEESRKRLKLSEKALAVWQGDFLPPAAKAAGIRPGDVIVGVDGKSPEMTWPQFNAYIRITYKVGDRVIYNLLRDGKRVDNPLTLPAHER